MVGVCHKGFKIELPIHIGTYPISEEQNTLPVSVGPNIQQPVAVNVPSAPSPISEAPSRPPYPENGN